MVEGFDYLEYMKNHVYRPLMDVHLRADIIDPASALEAYQIVFSPFLPALDESGLRERLRAWIEAGGTWIVGPLSDVRTLEGTKPMRTPFVCIEEWAGVFCKYELPGEPRNFTLRWSEGRTSPGSLWYSGFVPGGNVETIASYTNGPLEGLAAVTETQVGEGRIVLLGTLPIAHDLQKLLLHYSARCGISPTAEATPNVLAVPRDGSAGMGCIVIELFNRPGTIVIPGEAVDLLDGKVYSGKVEIRPYQVMVLCMSEKRIKANSQSARRKLIGSLEPEIASE